MLNRNGEVKKPSFQYKHYCLKEGSSKGSHRDRAYKEKRPCISQWELPSGVVRAYSDDIPSAVPDLWEASDTLVPLFASFAACPGLHLNMRKVVLVPLGDQTSAAVREALAFRHPSWSAVTSRNWAEYLGFVLGPGRGDRTWDKAFTKVLHRAAQWGALELGLYFAATVYNVYALSTPGFLLRLDTLPQCESQVESQAFRSLVRGPWSWALPEDLRSLRRAFGFVTEFGDAMEVSVAAKFRAAHLEARASGGLQVSRTLRKLDRILAESRYMVRASRWGDWFRRPLIRNIDEAVEHLALRGINLTSVEAALGAAGPLPCARAMVERVEAELQFDGSSQWPRRVGLRSASDPSLHVGISLCFHAWELHGRIALFNDWGDSHRPVCLRRTSAPSSTAGVPLADSNSSGGCMFGCTGGEDLIDHYCRCPVLARYGRDRLRLPYFADPAHRCADFLLLRASRDMSDEDFLRDAMRLAA